MKLALPNAQAINLCEAIWVLYRSDKLAELGFAADSVSIDRDENGLQVFPPQTTSYVEAEPIFTGGGPGQPPPVVDPDNMQIEVDAIVVAMQGRSAIIGGGAEITVDVSAAE